jgi:hypothetical protein
MYHYHQVTIYQKQQQKQQTHTLKNNNKNQRVMRRFRHLALTCAHGTVKSNRPWQYFKIVLNDRL